MVIEPGKTYIRTLRATSSERDTLAFQLYVDRLLSAADLYPRGLSESAIVCIRSFHALLPPLRQVPYASYGGGRLPAQWEEHVRTALKQVIQQAAHPLHGHVSSTSEAVIFADRAEMLASLAIDLRTGTYTQRWWWRSLFCGADATHMLLPTWLETPEYIPAALAHLATKREAVSFARRLSTHEARSLLQSITRTFALRELQPVLSALFAHSRPSIWEASQQPSGDTDLPSVHTKSLAENQLITRDSTSRDGILPQERLRTHSTDTGPQLVSTHTTEQPGYSSRKQATPLTQPTRPVQLPWQQWVPESAEAALSLEQQALLGVGLMLSRIPSYVRTASFAQAVYRWHTHTTTQFSTSENAPFNDAGNISSNPINTTRPYAHEDVPPDPRGHVPTPDVLMNSTEPRVPVKGISTMDEGTSEAFPSMVGVPVKGTLGAQVGKHQSHPYTQSYTHSPVTNREATPVSDKNQEILSLTTDEAHDDKPLESPHIDQLQSLESQVIVQPTEPQEIAPSPESHEPMQFSEAQIATQALEPLQHPLFSERTPHNKRQDRRFQVARPSEEETSTTQIGRVQDDKKKPLAQSAIAGISFTSETSSHIDASTMAFFDHSANQSNSQTDTVVGTTFPVAVPRNTSFLSATLPATDILSPYAYDMRIETMYGGLFYLVNLGLFLNLYGDFTTPLQPGIDLPIWDFVALLGEQMLGESIYADPIWSLLAQLAGRTTDTPGTPATTDATHGTNTPDYSQEPPGLYFELPAQWRVPTQWLSAFPETALWRWSKADGRLRVEHPAQFLLLDLPLQQTDPLAQLRDEMQPYADFFAGTMPQLDYIAKFPQSDENVLSCGQPVVRKLARKQSLSLQRWLVWLMPYIYARLQRALGLESTENPSSILCRHRAFISVNATHLHIDLALAELPIAIRIAGLDRDPGWVPAAGRFIAFHFS